MVSPLLQQYTTLFLVKINIGNKPSIKCFLFFVAICLVSCYRYVLDKFNFKLSTCLYIFAGHGKLLGFGIQRLLSNNSLTIFCA